MIDSKKTVAEKRNYSILDVQSAKNVAAIWLKKAELQNAVEFGLPEIDDRYHIWRIPLIGKLGANPSCCIRSTTLGARSKCRY